MFSVDDARNVAKNVFNEEVNKYLITKNWDSLNYTLNQLKSYDIKTLDIDLKTMGVLSVFFKENDWNQLRLLLNTYSINIFCRGIFDFDKITELNNHKLIEFFIDWDSLPNSDTGHNLNAAKLHLVFSMMDTYSDDLLKWIINIHATKSEIDFYNIWQDRANQNYSNFYYQLTKQEQTFNISTHDLDKLKSFATVLSQHIPQDIKDKFTIHYFSQSPQETLDKINPNILVIFLEAGLLNEHNQDLQASLEYILKNSNNLTYKLRSSTISLDKFKSIIERGILNQTKIRSDTKQKHLVPSER